MYSLTTNLIVMRRIADIELRRVNYNRIQPFLLTVNLLAILFSINQSIDAKKSSTFLRLRNG